MSKARRVIQYTMAGEEIRTYGSIREAQALTGVTHISSVCRRKRVSDGGSRWGYEGEPLIELKDTTVRRSISCSRGRRRALGEASLEKS